jgi:hypothetical protein
LVCILVFGLLWKQGEQHATTTVIKSTVIG